MSEHLPQEEGTATLSSKSSQHPFVAEALVSAGPRKSADDYNNDPTNAELCEDCAGVCWVGNRLVFWLCDGASDGIVLPRLNAREGSSGDRNAPVGSARILAQDLGQCFVEQACSALQEEKQHTAVDVAAVVATALTDVALLWKEKLTAFLAAYETPESRKALAADLPLAADGYLLNWSSTFTGGVFDPQERKFIAVNYGSSGGLVVGKQSAVIAPNDYPVSLLAWLKPEECLCSDVKGIINPEATSQSFDKVEGFAVVSDGLDRHDLTSRLHRLQGRSYRSLAALRTVLLSGAEQTADDKAVVFGRFL